MESIRFDYLEGYLAKAKDRALKKKTDKGEYESIVTNNYFDNWDQLELLGNKELKETIRKNIVAAERALAKGEFYSYELSAERLGLTVEEFKERLQSKIEDLIRNSDFYRATMVDVIENVMLRDGRWKSQFETNQSEGCLDPSYRSQEEFKMFGFENNELKNKELRPIYGYFTDGKDGVMNSSGRIPPPNSVTQYGNVTFKIKKEVALKKATITFHDSLGDGRKNPPTPAAKPHFVSFRYIDSFLHLETVRKNVWGGSYVEAQFHDQLTMEDVESIHISTKNRMSDRDMARVREVYAEYMRLHPESTIKLIEY